MLNSSRLDTGEERISQLEDILIESWKTQKEREQRLGKNKEQNIQGLWGNYSRCNKSMMGIPREERKEEKKYLKRKPLLSAQSSFLVLPTLSTGWMHQKERDSKL